MVAPNGSEFSRTFVVRGWGLSHLQLLTASQCSIRLVPVDRHPGDRHMIAVHAAGQHVGFVASTPFHKAQLRAMLLHPCTIQPHRHTVTIVDPNALCLQCCVHIHVCDAASATALTALTALTAAGDEEATMNCHDLVPRMWVTFRSLQPLSIKTRVGLEARLGMPQFHQAQHPAQPIQS